MQGCSACEWQLARPDGTVLLSFVLAPGTSFSYAPAPGEEITGPCATRMRVLPGGGWVAHDYYPQGWPGLAGPWPDDSTVFGIASAMAI